MVKRSVGMARLEQCLNCGAATPDEYCSKCGQRNHDQRASVLHLASEAASEIFELDSRVMRTIRPFLVKPGLITAEYNAGRRTYYSSPLRIYLFASFLFFLSASLTTRGRADSPLQPSVRVTVQEGRRAPNTENLRRMLSTLGPIGSRFLSHLDRVASMDMREFRARMVEEFINSFAKFVFLLLPISALLLMVLFYRSAPFYVEHLVFAVHLHAFAFLAMIIPQLAGPRWVWLLSGLVIAGHTLFALHRVYRQLWWLTIVKFVVLSSAYGFLLFITIGVSGLAALLML